MPFSFSRVRSWDREERSVDMTMKRIELPEEGELLVPDPVGANNLHPDDE